MKSIIDYFVNRSFFVNVLTVILIIMGIISFLKLRREDFPNVDLDTIAVRVDFPGATSEDVEKLISISVERELKNVNGIKKLNVLSGPAFSMSYIQVEPNFETDKVLADVRTAVDGISDFPNDVEDPKYLKIEYRLKPILKIAITGGDEAARKSFSRKLRDYLESVPGVSGIDIQGERKYIFDIQVSPDRLSDYELTLSDIAQSISDRNINIAGGSLERNDGNILIRTFKETKNSQDLGNIVLRSNDTGRLIRLKDVADIRKTFSDSSVVTRFFGERGIYLEVRAKDKVDLITTIEGVKKKLETYFKDRNVSEFEATYLDDSSFYIERRLSVLGQNVLQGFTLVFLALLIFLNFRVSVITLLGAPIAFTVSFLVMYFSGVTLNLISMFGLILVLGMLVDDAIIVAENFYQHLEKGMNPRDAARKSAYETLAPVTGTILTTMIAFSALLFISGMMGKFIISVPLVVIICLAASWLECFFILPSHLSDFIREGKKKKKSRWYKALLSLYRFSLKKALRIFPITIIGFMGLFVFSLFLAKKMPFRLFPEDEVRLSFLDIQGPKDNTLEMTDAAVVQMSQIAEKDIGRKNLLGIKSFAGAQNNRFGPGKSGNQYAFLSFYFDVNEISTREVNRKLESLTKKLSQKFPTYSTRIEKVSGGPKKGRPLNIEISGNSLEELDLVSDKIIKRISHIDGILAPNKDYEKGDRQYILDIKGDEARRLGLSNLEIALEVRRTFQGATAATIRESDEDMDIIVRFDEKSRNDFNVFKKIFIRNQYGRRIPLEKVVEIKEKRGIYIIQRKKRKRVVNIEADIDDSKLTSIDVNRKSRPIVEEILKKHPEITYQLSGENEDTSQSLEDFKVAGAFAMACILFILVGLFNSLIKPIIVMSAIPLGLIGSVLIFYFMKLPISFMALMGVIGLIGVVVNDSIVLLSFVDRRFEETGKLYESVLEGSASRFRAVILTTFTTVAGLLPLAHSPGGDPFLKPMAISFSYGLMFSTTLTLVFVPCCYYAYFKFKAWFLKIWNKNSLAA